VCCPIEWYAISFYQTLTFCKRPGNTGLTLTIQWHSYHHTQYSCTLHTVACTLNTYVYYRQIYDYYTITVKAAVWDHELINDFKCILLHLGLLMIEMATTMKPLSSETRKLCQISKDVRLLMYYYSHFGT